MTEEHVVGEVPASALETPVPPTLAESIPMPESLLVREPAVEEVVVPEAVRKTDPASVLGGSEPALAPVETAPPPPTLAPTPAATPPPASVSLVSYYLQKANDTIFNRKRAKLERIVVEVKNRGSITNDKVEKLLHVSDATASRYLAQLVQEGKLRREGPKERAIYIAI